MPVTGVHAGVSRELPAGSVCRSARHFMVSGHHPFLAMPTGGFSPIPFAVLPPVLYPIALTRFKDNLRGSSGHQRYRVELACMSFARAGTH